MPEGPKALLPWKVASYVILRGWEGIDWDGNPGAVFESRVEQAYRDKKWFSKEWWEASDDEEQQHDKPRGSKKAELCRFFCKEGHCWGGDRCPYAHKIEDLPEKMYCQKPTDSELETLRSKTLQDSISEDDPTWRWFTGKAGWQVQRYVILRCQGLHYKEVSTRGAAEILSEKISETKEGKVFRDWLHHPRVGTGTKDELCRFMCSTEHCRDGHSCRFAHSVWELKEILREAPTAKEMRDFAEQTLKIDPIIESLGAPATLSRKLLLFISVQKAFISGLGLRCGDQNGAVVVFLVS